MVRRTEIPFVSGKNSECLTLNLKQIHRYDGGKDFFFPMPSSERCAVKEMQYNAIENLDTSLYHVCLIILFKTVWACRRMFFALTKGLMQSV